MDGGDGKDVVIGGPGRDDLHGGDGRDLLRGGPGSDSLDGGGDADRLLGGQGDDGLTGSAGFPPKRDGDDLVRGGPGDDSLGDSPGHDTLDGGTGIDWARAQNVDLVTETASGKGSHTLIDIEAASGTDGDDVLIGDDGDNMFFPLFGDDRIEGGGGRDLVNLEVIEDFVTEGMVVDLVAGTATGLGGSDQLLGIEDIQGTEGPDTIRGDDGPNRLEGFYGNDILEGRGGDDTLVGSLLDPNFPTSTDTNDSADGGSHVTGDTCIGIEQATNCEFSELPARPVSRRS